MRAFAFAACMCVAGPALAHTQNLSSCTVDISNEPDIRLSCEIPAGSAEEFRTLQAALPSLVAVRVGQKSCVYSAREGLPHPDALTLVASAFCPDWGGDIVVDLAYLGWTPPPHHAELRIRAEETLVTAGVLDSQHRTMPIGRGWASKMARFVAGLGLVMSCIFALIWFTTRAKRSL